MYDLSNDPNIGQQGYQQQDPMNPQKSNIDPVTGTIISTVAKAASGYIGNKWREEAATEAYNRQRQLIAEERAYNDPSMQMQRLKAAGINPHMAYMKGTLNNVVSSSGKGAPMAQIQNISPAILESMAQMAAIRNTNARTDNVNQSTSNLEQDEVTKLMNNWVQAFDLNFTQADGKQALIETADGTFTSPEAFKAWMNGKPMPTHVDRRFTELLTTRANQQQAANTKAISSVKRYMAEIGVINTNDTAISVGIMMAKEQGIDPQTQRGLILTFGLINKVAGLLMPKVPKFGGNPQRGSTRINYNEKGEYKGHTTNTNRLY